MINNMEHFYQNIGENWFNFQDIYQLAVNKFNNAKFIEIGSWKGRSAAFMAVEILNSNKKIDFYCVDTWQGSEEHAEDEVIKQNNLYDEFIKNTEPVKHIISPIRKTSLSASESFPNECFDFIFIDAAHDYENVKADIQAWFPKLKKGGIIAGHDYHPSWEGVVKAVDEWSLLGNKRIFASNTSWIYFNTEDMRSFLS
jgi:predicted O-methyltransferase YrrM